MAHERAAGRHGLGLLSVGATSTNGFDALGGHWEVMEQRAEEFGTVVDRSTWRLSGPMHLADTYEQAVSDVAYGLPAWVDYFQKVAALPLAPDVTDPAAMAEALNASGLAVIGTVDDAIAQIERLQVQSGGFGCCLLLAHEWADPEATRHSFELLAQFVMPRFQGQVRRPTTSRDRVAARHDELFGAAFNAVVSAITDHQHEQEQRDGAP